jgi:hypothetical protein
MSAKLVSGADAASAIYSGRPVYVVIEKENGAFEYLYTGNKEDVEKAIEEETGYSPFSEHFELLQVKMVSE